MVRSTIAFLLCVAVAQLSSCLTVQAFSPLLGTRAVAPRKAKAVAAPLKKKVSATAPAKKKTAAAKKRVIKVTGKTAAKAKPKVKRVAPTKTKAIQSAKAKAKTKADQKAKANEAIRRKKAGAAAKARAAAKKATTVTAFNVARSGKDASLAIGKTYKPKKKATAKRPLFPALAASGTNKRPALAKKKTANASPAKAKTVLATKKTEDALNPVEFGLKVVRSEKGQEATATLIDGGLKLVEAILAEGKTTKVVIPRAANAETGVLKKPKVSNIGYKQLLDAGVFAGTEFLGVAKTNYEKFYVGGEGKKSVRVTRTAGKVDAKTGRVVTPVKENYVVKIGGERVMVSRPIR